MENSVSNHTIKSMTKEHTQEIKDERVSITSSLIKLTEQLLEQLIEMEKKIAEVIEEEIEEEIKKEIEAEIGEILEKEIKITQTIHKNKKLYQDIREIRSVLNEYNQLAISYQNISNEIYKHTNQKEDQDLSNLLEKRAKIQYDLSQKSISLREILREIIETQYKPSQIKLKQKLLDESCTVLDSEITAIYDQIEKKNDLEKELYLQFKEFYDKIKTPEYIESNPEDIKNTLNRYIKNNLNKLAKIFDNLQHQNKYLKKIKDNLQRQNKYLKKIEKHLTNVVKKYFDQLKLHSEKLVKLKKELPSVHLCDPTSAKTKYPDDPEVQEKEEQRIKLILAKQQKLEELSQQYKSTIKSEYRISARLIGQKIELKAQLDDLDDIKLSQQKHQIIYNQLKIVRAQHMIIRRQHEVFSTTKCQFNNNSSHMASSYVEAFSSNDVVHTNPTSLIDYTKKKYKSNKTNKGDEEYKSNKTNKGDEDKKVKNKDAQGKEHHRDVLIENVMEYLDKKILEQDENEPKNKKTNKRYEYKKVISKDAKGKPKYKRIPGGSVMEYLDKKILETDTKIHNIMSFYAREIIRSIPLSCDYEEKIQNIDPNSARKEEYRHEIENHINCFQLWKNALNGNIVYYLDHHYPDKQVEESLL